LGRRAVLREAPVPAGGLVARGSARFRDLQGFAYTDAVPLSAPSASVRRIAGRARLAPVLAGLWLIAIIALQAYLCFVRTVGVPLNPLPRDPLPMPRDPGDARLAQTFRAGVDGLEEITLYPLVTAAAANSPARVDFTLSDITNDASPEVVFNTTVAARALAAAGARYTLQFPALARSQGRVFRLEIAINGVDARAPVAFASVADNVYREGALLVNGRPEWGDLAFGARAAQDTPFKQFVSRALPAGWPRAGGLWLALLVAYDAACAALFWILIARRRPRPAPAARAA
jgi:hypothetical protein